jgi:hypothetical protein
MVSLRIGEGGVEECIRNFTNLIRTVFFSRKLMCVNFNGAFLPDNHCRYTRRRKG